MVIMSVHLFSIRKEEKSDIAASHTQHIFFKQKVKQAIKHALRSEELSRCPDESGFTRNDK